MARMTDSPLKPEHCLCLDRALERCPKIREVLAACEAAGIPVDRAKEELETHERMATALKKQFFPERV